MNGHSVAMVWNAHKYDPIVIIKHETCQTNEIHQKFSDMGHFESWKTVNVLAGWKLRELERFLVSFSRFLAFAPSPDWAAFSRRNNKRRDRSKSDRLPDAVCGILVSLVYIHTTKWNEQQPPWVETGKVCSSFLRGFDWHAAQRLFPLSEPRKRKKNLKSAVFRTQLIIANQLRRLKRDNSKKLQHLPHFFVKAESFARYYFT